MRVGDMERGKFVAGDSLGGNPKLRESAWETIEIQGTTLFYTKKERYYCFCQHDPREILPVGTQKYTLYWAIAKDPSRPIEVGNVNDCNGCTSIRDNGDKNRVNCIHVLAARKLAFGE